MAKNGISRRGWYPFNVAEFYSDPSVIQMTREQRWRYRDSLDFSWLSDTPGVGYEREWAARCGYATEDWKSVRHIFIQAFKIDGDVWTQKHMLRDYEAYMKTTERRSKVGKKGAETRWQTDALGMPQGCLRMAEVEVEVDLRPTEGQKPPAFAPLATYRPEPEKVAEPRKPAPPTAGPEPICDILSRVNLAKGKL